MLERKGYFPKEKNEYMALKNHGANAILLYSKFENTLEIPSALEARENLITYGNLETLSVTRHVLIFMF